MVLFKKLGINSERTREYSDEAHQLALEEAIEVHNTPQSELFYDATEKGQTESA